MRVTCLAAIAPAMAVCVSPGAAAHERPAWRLEAGATFQAKNQVRNPGDTDTQFNLNALQGEPTPWARHGFLVAQHYSRNEGSGTLLAPTNFANSSFARFESLTGGLAYRFSMLIGFGRIAEGVNQPLDQQGA